MTRALVLSAALLAITVGGAGAQPGAVTLVARPTELGPTENVLLLGRVSNGRSGETVTIEAKLCGQQSFRSLTAFKTAPAGV